MAIFVSQVVAKYQIHKIFKYQNFTAFLRFRPFFPSHVNLIYISESIYKVSRSNNNLEPPPSPPPSPGVLQGSRTQGLIGLKLSLDNEEANDITL